MVHAKKKKYMGGGKMKYADGGKMKYKKGGKFPDLTGDGKVTQADILKGRKVFEEGGKMKKMKKKEVTGVNALTANSRGIRGAGPLYTKAVGTTSSKKGGSTTTNDEFKMRKKPHGTYKIGGETKMTHRKDVLDKALGKGLTKKQKKRRGPAPMEKGGKITARKAKRTERQAGKEDRFAARNRMQPDPRTKEQKAAAYRKRRNKRLTRAMMGAITGAVVGGGEYNVRQRKS
mgnify:CR=1 FL=1